MCKPDLCFAKSYQDGALLFYGAVKDGARHRGDVKLRDLKKKTLHEWSIPRPPFSVKLDQNGDLYAMSTDPTKESHLNVPAPFLERFNWKGKRTFFYENRMMHHDFELLGGGRIAILEWEKVPAHFAKKINGGKTTKESQLQMYSDAIVEIDHTGKELWRWSALKHLPIEGHHIDDHFNRDEWTHANSIKFVERNPINNEPAYLISFRTLSRVMLVSRKTKKVLWQSPKGMFSAQHDASLLENNEILVFDNGYSSHNSRIVELNPQGNIITWYNAGGAFPIPKFQFYDSIMGAVQKLDKDHYLVSSSLMGYFFIINRQGRVIDKFFNIYKNPDHFVWPYQFMFQLKMYPLPDPLKKK